MPLIQCVDGENCTRSNCRFIHPDQPQWSHAVESNLAKRRRAEAAAAFEYKQEKGYSARSRGRDSTRRASITSSTTGWGGGRASPERPRRDPSPGWGNSNTSSGWGSNNGGGWGAASSANSGWGASGNDDWGTKSGEGKDGTTSSNPWGNNSGGAWDNPEPSSRRTSSSAPKSPARPPTSPRRERESPSRHYYSSSSKEKDRDRERHRERDRDRDRDRDRRREEDNASPSRSHRSHRRSPSPSKPPSHRESNRSPEHPKSKTSVAANDSMDIDPPNPTSAGAASSLFAPAHKDSSATSVSAPTTTTQPIATPSTEMPISIPFPRARQSDGLPPPPLGFSPSRPAPSLPSAQYMPPPPPPTSAPPAIPSPPATSVPSKSPPQSSDTTKACGLPTRPRVTGSRSPPQTSTLATPMFLHARSSTTSATPATPATPTASVTPTAAPVAPTSPTPASSTPSAPVPQATPPVIRPYEWIESLESLIKQNQVLQNCKKQYKRAEAQEQILLSRGTSVPKRGTGDTAPSLADLRRRIESTESDMQALMGQFAMRMDMFHRPSAVIAHVDAARSDEEALSLARKLSDQVSLLESEMQLLQITTVKSEDLKKLEEIVKGSSQAVLKERGERTKAVEDVKKDVKVFGDDLNRTRIECERLREGLISSGTNLEQVRVDAQTVRDQQVAVKEEVKAIKLEADATKADVQTVQTKMGEVGKDVTEIKAEIERLKTKLRSPPASPGLAFSTAAPGKRARNGALPSLNAMEVDDVLPPAKRVRTFDPLRPSPFMDSTTPLGSPKSVRNDGPSRKELLERIDALEDLVETLQGDVLQVGTDVQDQLEEFNERLGTSEERVVNIAAVAGSRSESAPPGKTTRPDFMRPAGRSSAPPARTTFPSLWNGPAKLPRVEELPSDDVIGQLQVDLDSMMKQVVGLWEGEGEWPAHIKMNLCKSLGIESLDGVFKPAPAPMPAPAPVVNGKTHAPEEEWVTMFKSMKEEQASMREEMRKERAEQDARIKAMMERLERTEEALDKSVKRRDEVERECEALKAQQAEQRQLLVHLQSVVDSLPKPGNGMLSPEVLLQDAVRNGMSPVQQELAALRKLATTVPHLLALAGISAEKDN